MLLTAIVRLWLQMYGGKGGKGGLPGEGEGSAGHHSRTRTVRRAYPAQRRKRNRWIYRYMHSLYILFLLHSIVPSALPYRTPTDYTARVVNCLVRMPRRQRLSPSKLDTTEKENPFCQSWRWYNYSCALQSRFKKSFHSEYPKLFYIRI